MSTERQRMLAARKEFKKPVTKFEQIDLTKAPFIPKGMTRAFRNTRYTVMVYDNEPTTKGTATKVMVQKYDDTPILRHWSEMQKIKNEIFGEETTAVEYYPAQSKLIDVHNIYWFWIFPNDQLPIPIL
jgi:D-lyxose ketol-isomerase